MTQKIGRILLSVALATTMIDAAEAQTQPEEAAALNARVERLEAMLAELSPDRVEELETQVEDLHDDLEDLQLESSGAVETLTNRMDRATRVFGYTTSYLQLQESGDLTFRGFRVNIMLDTHLSANIRFFAEIELEDGAFIGASEPDTGLIEVERGFFELKFAPAIGVRAGILLASFGHYNLDHQGWRFPLSERPLLYDRIFPATYADVGLEFFGTLVRTPDTSLSYRIAVVNGLRDGIGRVRNGVMDFSKGLRSARPLFHHDNNRAKSLVGRLALAVGEHTVIGASGYWGIFADDGKAAVSMGGLDLWLEWTEATIRAEGVAGFVDRYNVTRTFENDMGVNTTVSSDTPSWMYGAYVELEGRFMPKSWHDTALGHFGEDEEARLFFAGRVEFAKIDLRDTNSVGQTTLYETRFSASFGYRPIVQSAIRLEVIYGVGQGLVLENSWTGRFSFALGY